MTGFADIDTDIFHKLRRCLTFPAARAGGSGNLLLGPGRRGQVPASRPRFAERTGEDAARSPAGLRAPSPARTSASPD